MKIQISKNIRLFRKEKGYTQAELAKMLNISRNAVYRKLKGVNAFTLKDMVAIQEYLNAKVGGAFTLDYLFTSG